MTSTVLVLCLVAFAAGLIDAVAGGGGLLTVPALMIATPDPRMALGTNKGQSVFGAATALISFARAGRVDRRRAWPSFFAAFLGALIGVRLVFALPAERVRPVVVVLLLCVAVFFGLSGRRSRPRATDAPVGLAIARARPLVVAAAIGAVMGCYDGFFGPGTGTFLIAAYVAVFGDDLTSATANAKVSNFASNLASVGSFAIAGKVDFGLAVPMAAAQALGGYLGARAAMKGGERVVRGGVLLVTLALIARLAWQILRG